MHIYCVVERCSSVFFKHKGSHANKWLTCKSNTQHIGHCVMIQWLYGGRIIYLISKGAWILSNLHPVHMVWGSCDKVYCVYIIYSLLYNILLVSQMLWVQSPHGARFAPLGQRQSMGLMKAKRIAKAFLDDLLHRGDRYTPNIGGRGTVSEWGRGLFCSKKMCKVLISKNLCFVWPFLSFFQKL